MVRGVLPEAFFFFLLCILVYLFVCSVLFLFCLPALTHPLTHPLTHSYTNTLTLTHVYRQVDKALRQYAADRQKGLPEFVPVSKSYVVDDEGNSIDKM